MTHSKSDMAKPKYTDEDFQLFEKRIRDLETAHATERIARKNAEQQLAAERAHADELAEAVKEYNRAKAYASACAIHNPPNGELHRARMIAEERWSEVQTALIAHQERKK